MDETIAISTSPDETPKVPESPKPLAFTIDFGAGKTYDTQRHKALVEKFQSRHRRGQSLSKLEDTPPQPPTTNNKKTPSSANLPRKSSFQSEGYFSSDERVDRKNVRSVSINMKLRSELTLPLKSLASDKMTQSFPNGSFNLDTIRSPEIELKDISSPDSDLVSPFSPKNKSAQKQLPTPSPVVRRKTLFRQFSSPDVEFQSFSKEPPEKNKCVENLDNEVDKSDTISDTGTYTLETDNYTEEQKARMSIDREFNIEQVSVMKKTEEYIKSLSNNKERQKHSLSVINSTRLKETLELPQKQVTMSPKSPQIILRNNSKLLSPILSPTQNLSILDSPKLKTKQTNGDKNSYPTGKSTESPKKVDQGCFTSVTCSGVFSRKSDVTAKGHARHPSLTKSEIQIQMYVDANSKQNNGSNIIQATGTISCAIEPENEKLTNLPPAIGGISGKNSPTKIPSPVHSSLSRPRSRNSINSLNIDLSDSSLETESFLKPTQNYINSLQKRLSLDSDQESDYDNKCNLRLNNESQKSLHVRHNSFDDKNLKLLNKLEHFQNKNLQGIDQTFTNKLNQYPQQAKSLHKVQNSPNNSPIRRSSSFSTKNPFINVQTKLANVTPKETNIKNSPNLNRNSNSIQRSASTANIKPHVQQLRRSSINSEHSKIDRSQFGDTESSSEDDFEKNLLKKKDFSNLTNTRYNRAFSLRRGRLDVEQPQLKCPNTPEMRRKFQPNEHLRTERAISVDRRPIKTNDVPSRYLQSITKTKPTEKIETPKNVPKISSTVKSLPGKPQVFSRTDSGRFSVRTSKPLVSNTQKTIRKDGGGKKQSSGRSNSSLSSREVEFQNWKRRKSYDPMKAAAEGKKKAEMAKKQNHNVMTQSYNENNQSQDCDSSPSHSSSVHRSQSFHGTAALEQLISSEEDDLTLSADEGFSPPTPSPCELSPARTKLRHAWRDRLLQH